MDDLQKSILLNQLELLCQLKFGVDKFVQQLKRQTNFIEQFHRSFIVDNNSQQQRRRRRQWKAEFNKFCNKFDDILLSNRAKPEEESEDLDIYDKIWELFLSLDHSESSESQSNQNNKATDQLVLVCQLKCCMNAAVNQQKLQKEFIEQIQEFRQQSENVIDDSESSTLDRLHIDYEQYAKCSHSKEIISDVYAKIRDLFRCFVSPGVGIPEFGPFLRDIVIESDDDGTEEEEEVLRNEQFIETTNLQVNGQEEKEEEEEAPYIRCSFDGCLFSTNAARSLARHRQLSHRSLIKLSEDSDLPVQVSGSLTPIPKTNSQTLKCKLEGCSFSTLNSSDLIRHQLTHPQQQKRQFEWYEYSDPTKRPRPGRPRRMRCDFPGCAYTTDRLSNLTSHRATHDSEPRLSCDIGDCSYSTKVLRNLERHKLTHNPENRLNCDQEGCNYVTFRPDHLKVHHFKHHPERRFLSKQKQSEAKQNDNDFSSNDSTTTTAIDPNHQLRCDFGGCSYVTAAGSLADLQLHKLSQHSRPSLRLRANQTGRHSRPLHWKCDQAGCEYITDNAEHLRSHQLEHDT